MATERMNIDYLSLTYAKPIAVKSYKRVRPSSSHRAPLGRCPESCALVWVGVVSALSGTRMSLDIIASLPVQALMYRITHLTSPLISNRDPTATLFTVGFGDWPGAREGPTDVRDVEAPLFLLLTVVCWLMFKL